jgi:hypothetical protein
VLFTPLQEGVPELLNMRSEARFCEIVNSAADDSVSWKTEKPGCSATCISIIAVIVRDEDGFSGLIDNRPEQQLKLLQAVI